jgi:hypothetical protein
VFIGTQDMDKGAITAELNPCLMPIPESGRIDPRVGKAAGSIPRLGAGFALTARSSSCRSRSANLNARTRLDSIVTVTDAESLLDRMSALISQRAAWSA